MDNRVTKFMFYDLYWTLIKNGSNKAAGRFAKRLCNAMFTDNELEEIEDKEEAFVWSNIDDILKRSKEVELSGRTAKTLNRQMLHFAFFETYYRAIALMNEEQSGAYIKALCMYMFENTEPPKLPSPADRYFALAKLKLSLSKKRSIAAKSDKGENRTTTGQKMFETFDVDSKKIAESSENDITEATKPLSFEDFMRLHSTIKDDLYPNSRWILKSVNWDAVSDLMAQDNSLSQNRSLYWLLQNERIKTVINNG